MNSAQLALDQTPTRAVEADASWLVVQPWMIDVLRAYQLDLIERVGVAYRAGESRVLVQAPTGSGKTHLIASVARAATEAGISVVILATRTRIVRQIHDRLDSFHVPHGVIAAALPGFRWNAARVQVCSVDTLYRRAVVDARMPLPPAGVVIFDEAHLALGESRVAILEKYPDALHIGFTATPAKVSGRPLCDRFDVLVTGPSMRDLIASRDLVRPRVYSSPVIGVDELADVKRDSSTGDYAVGELGTVMSRPKLVGDVLQNWLRIANGKRTLVFACNKAHGAALVGEFTRAGVAAELLTDDNVEADREAALARLERGETTVVVNCFLLSYGIDVPAVEVVVLARPTRSVTLYLQAVGRGMRPAHGKEHVIVIDHGRVVESLGLPHSDFGWSLDADENVNRRARDAASHRWSLAERPRTCPECSHIWLVTEDGKACSACGWAPVPAARAVTVTAADLREIGDAGLARENADQFFAEALHWYRGRWPARYAEREKSARWACWCWTRDAVPLKQEKPPARYWTMEPRPCSVEVAGKLKSRMIAFAKARRA